MEVREGKRSLPEPLDRALGFDQEARGGPNRPPWTARSKRALRQQIRCAPSIWVIGAVAHRPFPAERLACGDTVHARRAAIVAAKPHLVQYGIPSLIFFMILLSQWLANYLAPPRVDNAANLASSTAPAPSSPPILGR